MYEGVDFEVIFGKKKRKIEEDKKREEDYLFILEDWKMGIVNGKMKKQHPSNHIECIPLSTHYYHDPKRNLGVKAKHLAKHPRTLHWHIPDDIKAYDFMEFVKNANDKQLEQLKYRYQAVRR